MRHCASPQFWKHYAALPAHVRENADRAFALLKENPAHPSLRFARKGRGWSARVCRGYRALAKERAGCLVWCWIGPHDEYERMIQDL